LLTIDCNEAWSIGLSADELAITPVDAVALVTGAGADAVEIVVDGICSAEHGAIIKTAPTAKLAISRRQIR
jgi:hypothetical protein